MGRSLPEDEAEKRAALLGNLAEPVLVGRGIEGEGQADVADDMLAVGKAAHGPQDHDGGQGSQGPDAGVGQQTGRIGMGERSRGDGLIEVSEMGAEGCQQVETLVTALHDIGRQRSVPSWARPARRKSLEPQTSPWFKARACTPFLSMVWMRTRRRRCISKARSSRVAGSGNQMVGTRSCRSRSRICRASRRSVFVLRTTMARILAASPTRTV